MASGWLCQLLRHENATGDLERLGLGYAAAIIPIN